jgi:membrane protein DedA with SNARE-associated domain/rhodanese-related sulfurtransferase
MQEIVHLVTAYGLWAVFCNVLLDEAGLPLPAYPLLAVAGALTATSSLSIWAVWAAAVSASAISDSCWYWVARYRGRRVLRLLCKISLSPDSCVRKTETVFNRVGAASLLFAKFVPGLGNLVVALSGITRISPKLFVPLQLIGAIFYMGLPIVLGRLFHSAVKDVLRPLARRGEYGIGLVVAALLAYLALRWYERVTFIRQLRMDRITVDELAALLSDEQSRPLLLDVGAPFAGSRDGIIPGALVVRPDEIPPMLKDYDRRKEIVVYCACPNEASAARAALHLRRAGFRRIRPLLGGVDAWVGSGRALQFEL